MFTRFLSIAASSALLCTAALAHEIGPSEGGKLGSVTFPNSCDAKVQADLQRAVAMLHSFWYNLAEKTFADILARDPTCTVTAWGYAAILMSNPLAGAGSDRQRSQDPAEDPARARLRRGGRGVLRGVLESSGEGTPGVAIESLRSAGS
jgi:hypothetical protein